MKKLSFLFAIITLTACSDAGKPNSPAHIDLTPNCGADQLRGLIGQDAAILRDVKLPSEVRVRRPGMALTHDYRPSRLNISISEDEIIDRVWCS